MENQLTFQALILTGIKLQPGLKETDFSLSLRFLFSFFLCDLTPSFTRLMAKNKCGEKLGNVKWWAWLCTCACVYYTPWPQKFVKKYLKKTSHTDARYAHWCGLEMFVFLFDKIINKTGGFVLSFSFQLSRSHRWWTFIHLLRIAGQTLKSIIEYKSNKRRWLKADPRPVYV